MMNDDDIFDELWSQRQPAPQLLDNQSGLWLFSPLFSSPVLSGSPQKYFTGFHDWTLQHFTSTVSLTTFPVSGSSNFTFDYICILVGIKVLVIKKVVGGHFWTTINASIKVEIQWLDVDVLTSSSTVSSPHLGVQPVSLPLQKTFGRIVRYLAHWWG